MPQIELTVEKSTKTKNDNYANKLVGKGSDVKTDFGIVEGGKKTFYMFTTAPNAVGLKANLELNLFDVVQKEFKFKDELNENQVATLSYLYPKRVG